MGRRWIFAVCLVLCAFASPVFAANGTGLKGEYFEDPTSGTGSYFNSLKHTRTDARVDFNWGYSSPSSTVRSDHFSVRWTGEVEAPFSETYTFYVRADDGVRLWVNDQQLINDWTGHAAREFSGKITLTAGERYAIRLEYFEGGGHAVVQLMWSTANQSKEIIPQAFLYPTSASETPVVSPDPDFSQTPDVVGVGTRIFRVTPTSQPSLRTALSSALPGDIIEIGAGEYKAGSSIYVDRSGTADRWILIRGVPGARINFSGRGALEIQASYVALEGLEVMGGKGNNVHVAPYQNSIRNIVLRKMKIHSIASGPGAAVKINRNNAYGAGVESVYIEDSDLQHAIGNAIVDGVGVRTAVVRGCFIHNGGQGNHGVFFKGGSSQILIENNLISGIRGNAAIMLGGDTFGNVFDPAFPNQEGIDHVVRNNFVADVTDSIFEVRGVLRGKIYHNTAVTQSGFTAFRLMNGRSAGGGVSYNSQIDISNNLIINAGSGAHQYIRNDGAIGSLHLGPQAWVGSFLHWETSGVPTFPRSGDLNLSQSKETSVVVNPSYEGLRGLEDSKGRYQLTDSSPAQGHGEANDVAPRDIFGQMRSVSRPSLGAVE